MPAMMCPHCHYLVVDPSKPCPSCGAEMPTPVTSQPAPTPPAASNNLRPPYDDYSHEVLSKRMIAVILCIAILVLGGFFYYKMGGEVKREEFNRYVDSINEASELMINGAIVCETMVNGVAKIWNLAIDAGTDFNKAIRDFYQDVEPAVKEVKSNQEKVMIAMKALQNPPAGCKNAYDTISKMYEAYNTLTNLAIDPSGSLQTYTRNKSAAISEFININKQLITRVPAKKPLD